MAKTTKRDSMKFQLLKAASAIAVATALGTGLAPDAAAIVSNGVTNDPESLVDTEGLFPNVGLLMIDQYAYNGGLGFCTGTLINPRMMLTAAHCLALDGAPIGEFYNGEFDSRVGVTFLADPRGGPEGDVVFDYLALGVANPYALTMSDVILNPNYDGFPEGDVAILALNTPVPTRGVGSDAATIATSPVMMSRLDRLEKVWTTGYGLTGTGENPTVTDTRRRVAQNMLGFIGSYNEFAERAYTDIDWEVLGFAYNADFQTFYFTDMDDPRRGTDDAFPYDFDVLPGDALSTDNPHTSEGISSSGDSGGPLFADIDGQHVQLTVNSGGGFFNQNVALSGFFGGVNFQTPLYLYANWIALNNPYKYLTARNGDFDWSDTAAWQETLDPAFVIRDASGKLVNGIAPIDQGQVEEDQPSIGEINKAPYCFLEGTALAPIYYPPGTCGVPSGATQTANATSGAAPAGNARGTFDITRPDGATAAPDRYEIPPGKTPNDPPSTDDRPGYGTVWAPREWVPNNTDGDTSDPDAPATYFDVTLGGSGTITLDEMDATIDQLSLVSTSRRLYIGETGSLTTWLSPEISAGFLEVDGALTSHRNIWMLGGMLLGDGLITLDPTSLFNQQTGNTLYNVAGVIMPGTPSAIGTLTIDGNVQFSSGSALAVNLGAGESDLLDVINGGAVDAANAQLGVMSVTSSLRYGDSFTVIRTGDGLLTGNFVTDPDDITGVLFARYGIDTSADAFDYGVLTIEAAPFLTAASYTSSEQRVVARALDRIRDTVGGYDALDAVFASADLTSERDLPTLFQAMSPQNAFAAFEATEMAQGIVGDIVANRATDAVHGHGRGMAMAGLESVGLNPMVASADPYDAMMMGAAAVAAAESQAADARAKQHAMMKDGWGAYLSVAGLVNSRIEVMEGAARSDLDGTVGVLGLDYAMDDMFFGAAVNYYEADAEIADLSAVDSESWGGSVYGGTRFGEAFVVIQGGYGSQSFDLDRVVPLLFGSELLSASPDGETWSLSGKVGYDILAEEGLFTPFISLDGHWISIDAYTETGGATALSTEEMDVSLVEGRIGLEYTGHIQKEEGFIRPKLALAVATDLSDDQATVLTSFAAFAPVSMQFVGASRRDAWLEYALGLEYVGANYGLSVNYTGADTGRADYGVVAGRVSVAW